MVLWVVVVGGALVFSFTALARSERFGTLAFKEQSRNKYFAEAGLARALVELLYQKRHPELGGSEVWRADGTEYTGSVGEGKYTVRIIGEAGRLDINTAPELVLRTFFQNAGLSELEANALVDAMLDWRDADEFRRLHGAESDYYRSLPVPYNAKNADFESVEELIYVKGMTRELLYGNRERKGVFSSLTVNGKNATVSVNHAPASVLAAVPGVTPAQAEMIVQRRSVQPFTTMEEVATLVGAASASFLPLLSVQDAGIVTIEVVGHQGKPDSGYPLSATVVFDSEQSYRFLSYKSPGVLK
jgi:general secretion pathway protein K